MAVYVDPIHAWGWQLRGRPVLSCHLFADSEDELMEFAEKIGLPWSWVQRGSLLHFDLVDSWRLRAIQAGALELGWRDTGRKWQELKKKAREERKACTATL